jgi:hypothetical protein
VVVEWNKPPEKKKSKAEQEKAKAEAQKAKADEKKSKGKKKEKKKPDPWWYVVEIARSKADFGTDKAKSIRVREKVAKSAKPKHFSPFVRANEHLYFLNVRPSDHFKPEPPAKLNAERVAKLQEAKRLNERQAERA